MNLGWPEILLIVFVVLILFGAKRIPEMMKAMGHGVKEFKKAASDLTADTDTTASAKPASPPSAPETKPDTGKPA
jgi:sec-independent protein translocase protein TatA